MVFKHIDKNKCLTSAFRLLTSDLFQINTISFVQFFLLCRRLKFKKGEIDLPQNLVLICLYEAGDMLFLVFC